MCIRRSFNGQFSLRNRVGGGAFLCFIVMLCGCGGEETVNSPVSDSVGDGTREEISPISTPYYPMTVGNRWAYRNSDGSEWSREVTETKKIGADLYYFFNSTPPRQDVQIESLRSPVYVPFLDRLVHRVNNKEINDVFWKTILQSVCKKKWSRIYGHRFSNGVWQSKKEDESALGYLFFYDASVLGGGHSELTLLPLPLRPGQSYEALQIKLTGSDNIGGQIHVFEATVVILGSVGMPETVVTPAGTFEGCLKIYYEVNHPSIRTKEYKLEPPPRGDFPQPDTPKPEQLLNLLEANIRIELSRVFMSLLPQIGCQTVWLAPGVGPVNMETPNGIAELIDYEVKPVASGK